MSAENIQKSLAGIIDELRTSVPEIKIIVSQIITSRDSSVNKKIVLFNTSLPAWVKKTTTSKSPVVLVDQWSGWNPAKNNRDEFHPSAGGAKIMAEKFLPAVETFLGKESSTHAHPIAAEPSASPLITITNTTLSLAPGTSAIATISLHSLSGKHLGTLHQTDAVTYSLPKNEPNGFYLLKVVYANGISQMQPITILK